MQGIADAHRIAAATRPLRIAVQRIIALRKVTVALAVGARVAERANVARSWRYHLAFTDRGGGCDVVGAVIPGIAELASGEPVPDLVRSAALCSRCGVGPGFVAADDLAELVVGEANTAVQITADACRGQTTLPVIVKAGVIYRVAVCSHPHVLPDAPLESHTKVSPETPCRALIQ